MLPASALPTLAAVSSARPPSSTGRRPKRSATGPQTICASPNDSISSDMVSWALAMPAPSSRVRLGSAGR